MTTLEEIKEMLLAILEPEKKEDSLVEKYERYITAKYAKKHIKSKA